MRIHECSMWMIHACQSKFGYQLSSDESSQLSRAPYESLSMLECIHIGKSVICYRRWRTHKPLGQVAPCRDPKLCTIQVIEDEHCTRWATLGGLSRSSLHSYCAVEQIMICDWRFWIPDLCMHDMFVRNNVLRIDSNKARFYFDAGKGNCPVWLIKSPNWYEHLRRRAWMGLCTCLHILVFMHSFWESCSGLQC